MEVEVDQPKSTSSIRCSWKVWYEALMVDVMGCIPGLMSANCLWCCFLQKGNSAKGNLSVINSPRFNEVNRFCTWLWIWVYSLGDNHVSNSTFQWCTLTNHSECWVVIWQHQNDLLLLVVKLLIEALFSLRLTVPVPPSFLSCWRAKAKALSTPGGAGWGWFGI